MTVADSSTADGWADGAPPPVAVQPAAPDTALPKSATPAHKALQPFSRAGDLGAAGELGPPDDDDLHQPWVPDPEPEWAKGCQGRCVRRGPVVMNGILVCAAISLVVSGALAQRSTVTEMCDECMGLSQCAITIGVVFCVFSLLAYVAVWRDWRWLLVIYVVVVLLVMMVLVGMAIAGGIFAGGAVDLGPAWRDRVARRSQRICDLQESYKCSGWDHCCGAPGANATEDCEWRAAECMDCGGDSASRKGSCKDAVQGWLYTTLALFVVAVAITFVVIAGLGYLSVRLRRLVRHPRGVN